jgi:hypothetical protein
MVSAGSTGRDAQQTGRLSTVSWRVQASSPIRPMRAHDAVDVPGRSPRNRRAAAGRSLDGRQGEESEPDQQQSGGAPSQTAPSLRLGRSRPVRRRTEVLPADEGLDLLGPDAKRVLLEVVVAVDVGLGRRRAVGARTVVGRRLPAVGGERRRRRLGRAGVSQGHVARKGRLRVGTGDGERESAVEAGGRWHAKRAGLFAYEKGGARWAKRAVGDGVRRALEGELRRQEQSLAGARRGR